MPNHGYCKNCWWWEVQPIKIGSLKGMIPNIGICHMQSTDCTLVVTNQDAYCPDYYNRKKGNREQKQTLEEWIKEKDLE